MTLEEFQAFFTDELGVNAEDVKIEFKDDKMVVTLSNVDEDMFDEDQDFGDGEDD